MAIRRLAGALAILVILPVLPGVPAPTLAAAGGLDTSFGADGLVRFSVGTEGIGANDLVVQPDGKIVTAGTCPDAPGGADFCLVRFNANGAVDTTFGSGGVVSTTFLTDSETASIDEAFAVVLQSDAKLVAAGWCSVPITVESEICLARYHANGSLDATFGSGGTVVANFPSTDVAGNVFRESVAHTIAVQADGRIVVAGRCVNATNSSGVPPNNTCVARFASDGSLDTTFGSGGRVITVMVPPLEGQDIDSDQAEALVLQADAKILTAGICGATGCLARYDAAGNLDATFGGDGILIQPTGTDESSWIGDLALQADGKILSTGGCSNVPIFCLSRYDEDGSLDLAFGQGGTTTTGFGSAASAAWRLAVQADGRIIVAGKCEVEPVGGRQHSSFCLARYDANGSLDTSFGAGGTVITPSLSSPDTSVQAVALQPDGKIVAAGTCPGVCVARYEAGDTPVAAIGLDWRIQPRFVIGGTLVPSPLEVHLFCDPAPAGTAGVAAYRWHIETPTGSIDPPNTTECAFDLDLDASTDEGVYPTTVDALDAAGQVVATAQRDVIVQDFLIVSIGDSVGSGEGNPDVRCVGACGNLKEEPAGSPAVWQERGCHRSHFAGSAIAPLEIENGNPRSSVTFLHLACSGASIGQGLLGAYDGIEGRHNYDPQLKAIQDAVGGREIDALLISIGANDIRFSEALKDCALVHKKFSDCVKKWDAPMETALAELPDGFFSLNACLSGSDSSCAVGLDRQQRRRWGSPVTSLGVAREHVYITTYFDPTTDESGSACDSFGLLDVNATERDWFSDTVIPGLNQNVVEAAGTYSWNLIDGAAGAFRGHGYCADDASRWIRTVGESLLYQGDIDGTIHPNELGHEWYGDQLLNALNADLFNGEGLPREPQPRAEP
jgi:uncharacterized delta-60 repeat protein